MNDPIEQTVARFRRLAERDGGQLRLLGVEGDTVRVSYRPGAPAADCADGSCTLPQAELEQLLGETLRRVRPGARLHVEPAR